MCAGINTPRLARHIHGATFALSVGVDSAEVLCKLLDDGPQFEVGQGGDILRRDDPATALATVVERRRADRQRARPQEVQAYRPLLGIGEVKNPWPAEATGH